VTEDSQRPKRPRRGRPGRTGDAQAQRGPAPTRTRLLALRVLERVARTSAYADVLLHANLARSTLSAPDRAFATELVYGTLRWQGRLDFHITKCLDQPLDKLEPLVASALRLGAYQIVFADVPDMAAVDESVRCVRAAGWERATGLVNAVLRRLAREHKETVLPQLEDDPIGHLMHVLSMPMWLAGRFIELLGPEDAARFVEVCNHPPPLTVRANPHHGGVAKILPEIATRFPEAVACKYAQDGIVLGRRGNAAQDPAFADGRMTVQDEGSQLVVDLLDPQPGDRTLDVCAAPGGKATAIAERVGIEGSVLALDRSRARLDLVRRATRRIGLTRLRCLERDASEPLAGIDGGAAFDRVLADVPCSGLGTLRRNPDARWRVQPEDPNQLAKLQLAILREAGQMLRPGGALVYSTCTLLPEENEDVVEAFLAEFPSFARASIESLPENVKPLCDAQGQLRCLPHIHDTDGFYAVRIERVT
jgi:16S rRNA (cytosine967-C5)-methyltransferase